MKQYIIFDLDGTLLLSTEQALKIIVDYFSKHFPEISEKRIYNYFFQTSGTPLIEQVRALVSVSQQDLQRVTSEIYQEILQIEAEFFPGVISLLEKLSEKYIFFLSTGNSTPFALKHLQKGNVSELFSVILGSDIIPKGDQHISQFQEYSGDTEFIKKTLYVGDGITDRRIAQEHGIDFIHIGNEGVDEYEVQHIADVLSIIEKM